MNTRYAKMLLRVHRPAIQVSEQRQHRDLVVLLTGELHRRDTGELSVSHDALVGPYLDHLPTDGSDELDDGTALLDEEPSGGDSGWGNDGWS
jgi:hypothetical protein